MELMNQSKDKITFVRVLIGTAKTGKTGVKAPTRTLSIKGSTVDEVYDEIMEILKNTK